MKVLLGLLAVVLAALLGVGGYFVYDLWQEESASRTAQLEEPSQEEDTAADQGARNRPTLARMRPPDNVSETYEQLAYAMEQNLDAVGWLQIPDTSINNVVMQSSDNRYYLRRTEDGNEDIYGCYFMDFESTLGGRNVFRPNTIIYGHSDLKDNPEGPRFSELFKYTDQQFAQTHPYLYLTSLEERYIFEIFSVFYTDTDFNYIRVNMTDAEALVLGQEAQAKSIYQYPVELREGDRFLTLSTCTSGESVYTGDRFVVMGRLLERGFQEKGSVTLTKNTI